MEIGEQMIYLARLKGLSRVDAISKIKYWFEKMQMETWWKQKVEDLSKGMQQKVQFVACVLHNPELLILDEPFSGFDPVNAEIIKDEIMELNQKGSTIIFSTHRMESVEVLCNHIVVLNKSHKILDGKIKDIRNSYRNNSFKIVLDKPLNILFSDKFDIISEQVKDDGIQYIIQLKETIRLNAVLLEIIPQAQIVHLEEIIPSMNDIFIEKVNQISFAHA